VKRDLEVSREPAQARTRDGSPVEFYELLPAMGEPELVHGVIPAGATVLELGCGAGRITRALVALGHPVTAVDDSPEMLAEVRAGETVFADIRQLHLGRTFGCVLLMSNLVNAGEDDRRAFLRCCREHVALDGVVVIERMDPQPRWGARRASTVPSTSRSSCSRTATACAGSSCTRCPTAAAGRIASAPAAASSTTMRSAQRSISPE